MKIQIKGGYIILIGVGFFVLGKVLTHFFVGIIIQSIVLATDLSLWIFLAIGIISMLREGKERKKRESKNALTERRTTNISENKPSMFFDIIHSKLAFNFWLFLIGIILLLISAFSNSGPSVRNNYASPFYSSYQLDSNFSKLIQIYIFCISMYFAFLKYKNKKIEVGFLFAIVAIIFNPFFVFPFDNSFQNIIEFFAVLFFVYFIRKEYKELKKFAE